MRLATSFLTVCTLFFAITANAIDITGGSFATFNSSNTANIIPPDAGDFSGFIFDGNNPGHVVFTESTSYTFTELYTLNLGGTPSNDGETISLITWDQLTQEGGVSGGPFGPIVTKILANAPNINIGFNYFDYGCNDPICGGYTGTFSDLDFFFSGLTTGFVEQTEDSVLALAYYDGVLRMATGISKDGSWNNELWSVPTTDGGTSMPISGTLPLLIISIAAMVHIFRRRTALISG